MKRSVVLFFVLILSLHNVMAQAPKWVEKAKKAVFSVITYDESDKILNTGNGFFVSEDGVALSDYSLFKGAYRAVILDAGGKQMPVDVILGANDIYDVVKFRVLVDKKVPFLKQASIAPTVGAKVYLLPYSTQKDRSCTIGQLKSVSSIASSHHYYAFNMSLKDKMVSCPVTNAEGEVLGLVQKASTDGDTNVCYAVGASFAMSQKIGPLSFSDNTLRAIHIKKGIPDTEEQALVYLLMASTQVSPKEYGQLLNDFVAKYPENADGYIRRARNYVSLGVKDISQMDKATADLEKALKIAKKKDDVHYNIAKLIYAYQLSKPEKVYKDWTYDKALDELKAALDIDSLPIYTQLEGDIYFAKQNYQDAFTAYAKVNKTNLASASTFYSTAKTKELMKADIKEVVALMDSCIAHCVKPYGGDAAPYLLERARVNMEAKQYRAALLDYDSYYDAAAGQVNDVYYYYREQAALKAKQFQRALNDITKAVELNPKDLTYRAELSVVNLRVGRFEEAIKVLDEALAIDPKYAEAYRLKGICELQLKKNKEACANFAKAKELGDTAVDKLIAKHCK
ncbi:tetratricopeptide repeat protein [uncultured Bacteroides sp.]|uniref:tetratricopeptide repeat protein n=1 Tax=uncultured Bacteroides sp. TaxID=162156 RepID=UPI002AAB7C48|nr:tetratricopeptide repeat protein [uncultured Bacteroides sp.]